MTDISRRDFLTVAAATVVAPQVVAADENVKASTRERLARLVENSGYKPNGGIKKCLDGRLIDPECDDIINKDMDIHENRQQILEVKKANEALEHLQITIALIQLAIYIDLNKYPSKEADNISKIPDFKLASPEVKSLVSEFLERKKNGGKFNWENDGKRLINLANSNLDKSEEIRKTIGEAGLQEEILRSSQGVKNNLSDVIRRIQSKNT